MQIFIRNYSNLFAILFLILLFQSCKKSDQVASPEKELSSLERKFFFTNRTGDLTEGKLVDFLIKQNRSKNFVEKTTKIIGFPRWEKMIAVKRKSGISGRGASDSLLTTYFVPFVRDSQNYVNASLIISVYPNDTTFAYRSDWEYRSKIHGSPSVDSTAEAHAVFFMFLDNRTFGYTEFYLTDDELFPLSQPIIGGKKKLSFLSISTQSTGKGQSAGYYENCVDFFVCGSPSSPTCTGPSGCDYLNCPLPPGSPGYCYLVTTVCVGGWLDPTGGSSGSTGSGSSTGSGGGGNTGGGAPPPCPGTSTSQRGQTVTPGCDPGWNGIGTSDPSTTFTINGITFTTSNYPGKNNGLPWKWWENASILAPFGGLPYGSWAINYLSQNPHLSFLAFQNYFMTQPEGTDDSYNQIYWDDPNLFFPQQSLPTFNSFKNAFPKRTDPLYNTAEKLYSSIGGELRNKYNGNPMRFQNTCALRISKALNYSGVTIPAGIDRFQGADGKFYFINCNALLIWMKKTFGVPSGTNYLVESQGGVQGLFFPYYLEFKKGIYIMTPNNPDGCPTSTTPQTGFCASGHADLIENGKCDGGCHFNAIGGVKEIFIWELQ